MNLQKEIAGHSTPMDAITSKAKRWIKYLIAIVIGNIVYLILTPRLPPVARHRPYHADIGLFVDLWFCVAIYGLIELLLLLVQRIRR